jgi:serine protease Do
MKIKNIITHVIITTLMLWMFQVKAQIPTDIVEKARNATVLVATDTGAGGGFGSGVVIDSSGLIITNYHVIHRAELIRVFFYDPKDNNYYLAETVGIDPIADLALLQLKMDEDKLPLTYLQIESENFVIAEEVMAIGHPMGIQWTISLGHIANIERTGKVTPYVTTLQHSAEIHKGNSGGPLINKNGDVVGINTYLLMPDQTWSGIAYAVRGDIVQYAIDAMQSGEGEVKYPAFRLNLRSLNEYGVKWLEGNHPDRKFPKNIFGMIVVELEEGEWADQQGMKLFDIVISIDGEPVNNMFEVRTVIMGNYKPGQTVNLIIIRDGHFRKLKYELSHIDFDGYLKFFDDSTKDKSSGEEGSPMIPEEPKDDEPSAFEEKDEH